MVPGVKDIALSTAGGKNAWMGHYFHNSDPLKSGDLVLMDITPDYKYYTSDLVRMWPVNGSYTKDQRDMYGFIIDYRNTLLKYIRPGVTPSQVMEELHCFISLVITIVIVCSKLFTSNYILTLQ